MRWICLLVLAIAVVFIGCDARPKFSDEKINSKGIGKTFPKGFLFGAATSAYQIEGGQKNDWTLWEKAKNEDGKWRVKLTNDPRCPEDQPCSCLLYTSELPTNREV